MTELYHYTCEHTHGALSGALADGGPVTLLPGIELIRRGRVAPWPSRFLWATDLAAPMRDALGLTATVLTCDRAAFRYRILEPDAFLPWSSVARAFSREMRDALEAAPGARPRHWYVSASGASAIYDPPGAA